MSDTLIAVLKAGVASLMNASEILMSTPDDFQVARKQQTLTVFLYRITVNPDMRQGLWRVLADGRITRSLLPIDLHYMNTVWARGNARKACDRTVDQVLLQGGRDRMSGNLRTDRPSVWHRLGVALRFRDLYGASGGRFALRCWPLRRRSWGIAEVLR